MSENNETHGINEIKVPTSSLEHEMRTSFLDYAMSVIVDRALPDVRDGCKPVHRRILYVMNDVAPATRATVKSARIVGDVMGKYHPHGDSSIYDAMARMAQDFSMGEMLVSGQGNFGSRDGDKPAAMRYTEARLSKLGASLMDDMDKGTVDWIPNFDGTLQEPQVLPAKFPNFLINGGSGIAVGMATNVPTYNLGEVCNAILTILDNKNLTNDELFGIIPGPDFPTGGLIMGHAGSYKAHNTGRGSIIVRSKTHIEEFKDHEAIIVDEIPYQVNKAQLIIKIADLVKDKRIEGISAIRDESSKEGLRIVIELKRDAITEVVLNHLFQYTEMQNSFPVNMMALNRGRPMLFNVRSVLDSFIEFRIEVIRRRTIFDLNKARNRAHTLLGLSVAVGNLDEIITLIKGSESPEAARTALVSRGWKASDIESYIKLIDDPNTEYSDGMFHMSEDQAKAILELQLHRLTGLEREKIHKDLTDLGSVIKELLEILGSHERIVEIIRAETTTVRDNWASPRRSEISDAEIDIDIEDLIAREDMVITVSNTGYIKRVSLDTYRAQKRGGKGRNAMATKDDDYVVQVFVANTHTPLLFFSSAGICYKLKTYKLPEAAAAAKGRPLVNLLPLSNGETITAIMPEPEDKESYLMFVTASGTVRRNKMADFESIRANGKIAMKLDEGDSLISVLPCTEDQDVFLSTYRGRCIRFAVPEIRVFAGRNSTGVRGLKLGKDDRIIGMAMLNHGEEDSSVRSAYIKQSRALRRAATGVEEEAGTEDADEESTNLVLDDAKMAEMASREEFILTISENGFGKRTSSYEYRLTHRGGGGFANIKLGGKNTAVAGSFPVDNEHDIIMVTDGGKIIRTPVAAVRIAGRATAGVTLFRTSEKEKVVSAIAIEKEEIDDIVAIETSETEIIESGNNE
ncbi:MAG: DNA gyrase subunit A [Alphaproteobacteria bacterium]|nr:DNA gyrase subunit A [Alphaproteobacteria bacterium]MBN2675515.1 DNA gyrase subunit A [Alphaproteobacteria bacterium]